jgi:hypothetical protein
LAWTALNMTDWTCLTAAYVSTSLTNVPSRYTRAMPVCGPRNPIQVTDVPVKLKSARAPAVADRVADPLP